MPDHDNTRPIVAEGESVMSDQGRLLLSRRQLLKYGGLTAAATAAVGLGPRLVGTILQPGRAQAADRPPDLKLVGTDGWISLPPEPRIFSKSLGVWTHPDSYAPPGRTTYIFGFANATGLQDDEQFHLKNRAQHSAPLFWAREGVDFRVQLTNVGLAQRPDLFDEHTLHWHGFKNVIPFFDGEPTGSVSIPQGQTFTYVYVSHDPGTYMFHCHVEDTEHVHMGMTGLVFVRPAQDQEGNSAGAPISRLGGNQAPGVPMGYAYNDSVGVGHPASTAFDREFAMFLSEVWGDSHWADAHIQLPEWSDYRADFSLLNGRVYPDTLERNGSINPFSVVRADGEADPFTPVASGGYDLVAPAGRADLANQPMSSLVTCMPGERVLLRFANLGFKEAAMTLAGLKMNVVGRDATHMRGRDGTDTSYRTNIVSLGAGESFDAIFTAPPYSGGAGSSGNGYDAYVLYNRAYTHIDNLGGGAGQRTEVRVYPSGVAPQQYPNDWGL
jgi:FtsP/CotA-like multicopper oxidase with cupredoxin domain